jgi:Xaa-Pro aminopeptidase
MDKTEFFNKRQKLFNLMNDNSMFILEAPKEGEDKYNPNRNFLYFTGIKESQDKLVLIKKDGKKFETLFIKPYDPIEEKWVGRGLNQEEAEAISGIRDIRYIDSFDSFVGSNLKIVNNLYIDFDRTDSSLYLSETEQKVNAIKQKYPYVNLLQGRTFIQHLRTIKSSAEIEEIKKAIHITRLGIEELMKNSKDGLYEYQLESYFDQTIKYNGANGYAFDTIAASGKNSCCLHYSANQDIMHNGDLILFDLGSTYNYYCSDISRTFPVNGKFTPRQRQIYEIVLNGQKLMFKNMKPGITQRELNQILVKYFQVELKKIGLIKDDSEVSKYYYHGVSHHMGLDCHDLADYTPLEVGAVISNEPGLYIPEENIGIRIEDDVLITEDGCINLSNEILKEPDEIEAFMAKYNKNI